MFYWKNNSQLSDIRSVGSLRSCFGLTLLDQEVGYFVWWDVKSLKEIHLPIIVIEILSKKLEYSYICDFLLLH